MWRVVVAVDALARRRLTVWCTSRKHGIGAASPGMLGDGVGGATALIDDAASLR